MEALIVPWAVLIVFFLVARSWLGVALTMWVPVTLGDVVVAGLWPDPEMLPWQEPAFRFTILAMGISAVAVLGVVLLVLRRRICIWLAIAMMLCLAGGWAYMMYRDLIGASAPVPPSEWLFYAGFLLAHLLAAMVILPLLRYRPRTPTMAVFD